MLLSLRKKTNKENTTKQKNKQTNKQTIKQTNSNKTQKQQQHILAPVYITDGDAIRQLL